MTAKCKKLPKSWPSGVAYLSDPKLSPLLSPEQLGAIRSTTVETVQGQGILIQQPSNIPCSDVRITPIIHAEHPACGQHGLFAVRHLPPGTFILHYIGYVHGPDDVRLGSDYDISLDREHDIGIDATACGNEARFVNDYRGVNPNGPNAEFRDCWVKSKDSKLLEKRIGIFVLPAGKSAKRSKGIAKNEEVLVSYGKGFWSSRQGDQS